MNNPNPFVPQGSLLEQQSKRRSRLKLGVLCVLAVGIAGLAAMLIQGCKREEDTSQNPSDTDNSQPQVDTNNLAATDTNETVMEASNPPVSAPPQQPVVATPPPSPPPAAPTETEYVIVRGDTYSKIAKQYGVTVKVIEDANPDIQPTRLKVGQKLVIPAGASTTGAGGAAETENGVATSTGGDEVYVVKAGDTLTHIAHHFGITVKALEAENNLSTTKIHVSQKLNIPAKAQSEQEPVNTPPTTTTPPAPAPVNNPPPAQTNPNSPAGGQQQ
jgi:LysM repeat protein